MAVLRIGPGIGPYDEAGAHVFQGLGRESRLAGGGSDSRPVLLVEVELVP
jgi:hypothetical protein